MAVMAISGSGSRVLKAHDARSLEGRVAFNYDDIQQQCQERLREATRQAKQVLDEAHQEAAAVRQAAQSSGREMGRIEGMNESERKIEQRARELAEQMAAARLKSLLPALESAARNVATERERWLANWEASAVRLSVAIAGRILRAELTTDPERARDMIADALQTAAGSARIQVRLHPDDVKQLGDKAVDVVRSLSACGNAAVLEDASIERGGSVVETQHGVIDARLETQLDRILQELLQTS